MNRQALALAVALGATLAPRGGRAFPPYRSTDAGTADAWVLEARLGLARVSREAGESVTTSPLVRANLGLPWRMELVGELEYLPAAGRLADAAAGVKWIPVHAMVSAGLEALVLLPVTSSGGAGVEASLVGTVRRGPARAHLNATVFHDARTDPAETGWKAGLLGELRVGRASPGLELATKQAGDGDVAVVGGAGLIVRLGRFDVRAGVHLGLTGAAADVTASLWLSGEFPLR